MDSIDQEWMKTDPLRPHRIEPGASDASSSSGHPPLFEHASVTSTGPTIASLERPEPTILHPSIATTDDQFLKKYTRLPPDAAQLASDEEDDASHYSADSTIEALDRYGFYDSQGNPTNTTKELPRAEKWRAMATRNDTTLPWSFKVTPKLVDRVYKGIPDCWRASAWQSFLIPVNSTQSSRIRNKLRRRESGEHGIEAMEVRYKRHTMGVCEFDAQIDLDVPRTISGHVMFRRRYGNGQRLLFRVLHAIALEFPKTGYVQGMASVAATLLCYYPEETAFLMLSHLWLDRGLDRLYEPGFPYLLEAFQVLEARMQKSRVGRHLLALSVNPMNFATRWYLTLFHHSLPFHTQLRVWDVFMLSTERYKVLEATTLALIDGMESELLQADFEGAMEILTAPVKVGDDDTLVKNIRKRMR